MEFVESCTRLLHKFLLGQNFMKQAGQEQREGFDTRGDVDTGLQTEWLVQINVLPEMVCGE